MGYIKYFCVLVSLLMLASAIISSVFTTVPAYYGYNRKVYNLDPRLKILSTKPARP